MPLILHLMRHAKSSWAQTQRADKARPLSPRGERAALVMGAWLRQTGQVPDFVVCSVARRSLDTWDVMKPVTGCALEPHIEPVVYHGGVGELGALIGTFPRQARTVLIIGHNPTMETFAARLAAGSDNDAVSRMAAKFPTAAVATFACSADTWQAFDAGTISLAGFVAPKDLV